MKRILIVMCIMSSFFMSCKKNGTSPANTQVTVVGKWNLVDEVIWHTFGGVQFKDTLLSVPGNYIDFGNDGKVTECWWDGSKFNYETVYYKVNGDILTEPNFPDSSILQFSGNTMTIFSPSTTESNWWHYKK